MLKLGAIVSSVAGVLKSFLGIVSGQRKQLSDARKRRGIAAERSAEIGEASQERRADLARLTDDELRERSDRYVRRTD